MSPILTEIPPGPCNRVGMVARWRPVHRIHAAILRGLCSRAEYVVIGIGSSNRYNAANPFTPGETAEMIRLVLPNAKTRLELMEIPDLGDGPRWAEMVRDMMDPLDLFVSANAWVRDLVAEFWPVVHPIHFIQLSERAPISGTAVREAMARGEAWQEQVPRAVADHLEEQGLDARLRREFGPEILARQSK
jgi:nicotinamide-nucleotide adenylyltransferase